MTTINDISDLVRILREQPDWAEALRALLLTQELLDLPGRFDRFVEIQQETNRLTAQRLEAIETRMDNVDGRLGNVEGRLGNVEGRLGNLEGGQYERTVRTKVLARTQIVLGFDGARVALNQEGLVDSQLNSAVARAVRDGRVSEDGYAGLFEADLVISARDNRHAVVEVSITAGRGRYHQSEGTVRNTGRRDGRDGDARGDYEPTGPGAIGAGGSGGCENLRHPLPIGHSRSGRYP